jgi:hypothetical protein
VVNCPTPSACSVGNENISLAMGSRVAVEQLATDQHLPDLGLVILIEVVKKWVTQVSLA